MSDELKNIQKTLSGLVNEDSITALKTDIFELLRGSVKDLWKKEDTEFLKQLAEDLAKQKLLAETSETPKIHRQNIDHLAATIQGEIVRKGLKIKRLKAKSFVNILQTVIKTIAVPVIQGLIKNK